MNLAVRPRENERGIHLHSQCHGEFAIFVAVDFQRNEIAFDDASAGARI